MPSIAWYKVLFSISLWLLVFAYELHLHLHGITRKNYMVKPALTKLVRVGSTRVCIKRNGKKKKKSFKKHKAAFSIFRHLALKGIVFLYFILAANPSTELCRMLLLRTPIICIAFVVWIRGLVCRALQVLLHCRCVGSSRPKSSSKIEDYVCSSSKLNFYVIYIYSARATIIIVNPIAKVCDWFVQLQQIIIIFFTNKTCVLLISYYSVLFFSPLIVEVWCFILINLFSSIFNSL